MQTEYTTTRKTVVTAKPLGRPRKQPGDPKSPYTLRKPKRKGAFELIGDDPDFCIVDATVPRKLGEMMQALFETYA